MHIKLIPLNPNGVAKIAVLGRVSSEGQDVKNIAAAQDWTKLCLLKDVWNGPSEMIDLGEQGSGMLRDRNMITKAYELIHSGTLDLIAVEDSSRIYRNPRHLFAFVQDCVDAGVRFIAFGDGLDTANTDWEVVLSTAALRHGLYIPDTRRRIRRTATSSFHGGGMVGKRRFGYRKLTKEEAASGKYGPPGLRLIKLPEWTSVFDKAREMLAVEGRRLEELLKWVKDATIPPPPYAKKGWTTKVLRDLLRNPILYGLRRFRMVVYEYVYETGKHIRKKNESPETELCPSLAHMTKEQWDQIQVALNGLGTHAVVPAGAKSPRYRIPRRRSQTGLQHARCQICGGLMYVAGDGVVKCRNTLPGAQTLCWNHVQVKLPALRAALVSVVENTVNKCPPAKELLLDEVLRQLKHAHTREMDLLQGINAQIQGLQEKAKRISDAIEASKKFGTLLDRLDALEEQLAMRRQERQKMLKKEGKGCTVPSRESLASDLNAWLMYLAASSFEFADLMRKIFPRLAIQPIQALAHPQVHPRLLATLDLTEFVTTYASASAAAVVGPQEFIVDLFDPPLYIKHLESAVRLRDAKRMRQEKCTLNMLADKLGINHMALKRALRYKRLMDAAGLAEPYRVLTKPPDAASRWRKHREYGPAAGEIAV